jgi:hypothetical protein
MALLMLPPKVVLSLTILMGIAHGYLVVPSVLTVPWLARRAAVWRPGMGDHPLSRTGTIVAFFIGLLLVHGAIALSWLDRLATLSDVAALGLGRYWGGALFVGMVFFAFTPARSGGESVRGDSADG